MRPVPGSAAPALKLPRLGGGIYDLADSMPENFTVVFFYRGVHCPLCKAQLQELNERRTDIEKRGLKVAAVSMDDAERADRQTNEWDLGDLDIGYDMTEATARSWGLFLSKKERDGEPDMFAEPAIAIIYPDGRLYALYTQSVPFARPRLDDLLKGLDFIIEKNYPARGTLAA
jgi:peroxiredoxin